MQIYGFNKLLIIIKIFKTLMSTDDEIIYRGRLTCRYNFEIIDESRTHCNHYCYPSTHWSRCLLNWLQIDFFVIESGWGCSCVCLSFSQKTFILFLLIFYQFKYFQI